MALSSLLQIIDSGTSLNYFPRTVYQRLLTLFQLEARGPRPGASQLQLPPTKARPLLPQHAAREGWIALLLNPRRPWAVG